MRSSASPRRFFGLTSEHLVTAYQQMFALVYHGRFDSYHVHHVMTLPERRYFYGLLSEAKENEAAEMEKARNRT